MSKPQGGPSGEHTLSDCVLIEYYFELNKDRWIVLLLWYLNSNSIIMLEYILNILCSSINILTSMNSFLGGIQYQDCVLYKYSKVFKIHNELNAVVSYIVHTYYVKFPSSSVSYLIRTLWDLSIVKSKITTILNS